MAVACNVKALFFLQNSAGSVCLQLCQMAVVCNSAEWGYLFMNAFSTWADGLAVQPTLTSPIEPTIGTPGGTTRTLPKHNKHTKIPKYQNRRDTGTPGHRQDTRTPTAHRRPRSCQKFKQAHASRVVENKG